MSKVAILYGFCEGPRLSKKLERALKDAGFEVIDDARHADVILAHSAGCWMLPEDATAHTVLLVGVGVQPLYKLARAFGPKVWHDFLSFKREGRAGAWLRKSFWNLIYFWRMRRGSEMLHAHKAQKLSSLSSFFIIVRNRYDLFSTPNLPQVLPLKSATFVDLPGEHDDLWEHPEPYVRLLVAVQRLAI